MLVNHINNNLNIKYVRILQQFNVEINCLTKGTILGVEQRLRLIAGTLIAPVQSALPRRNKHRTVRLEGLAIVGAILASPSPR